MARTSERRRKHTKLKWTKDQEPVREVVFESPRRTLVIRVGQRLLPKRRLGAHLAPNPVEITALMPDEWQACIRPLSNVERQQFVSIRWIASGYEFLPDAQTASISDFLASFEKEANALADGYERKAIALRELVQRGCILWQKNEDGRLSRSEWRDFDEARKAAMRDLVNLADRLLNV